LGRDDTPRDEFFERSDHFSFARRGIPAIYLLPDFDNDPKAKSAYQGHNHKPSDDLRLPFHWQAGARFAHVAQQVVRRLADTIQPPLWYADSRIGALYAKGQPKATRRAPRPRTKSN
jgi:Zn-dependent M28 family amino/carboxypeptidase